MPGKVGVKIKAGRNLPVMDRGSDTTDAYVEIKLGNVTQKTDVCRKSLNPQWNTDWFRFEVDDAELQDEPLQIRLMDHDTYSANDAIGKVNISLNPLCLETAGQSNQGKGAVMSGWIPVFDTMHGIRGEVNIIVKVDLFSDVNKFRQSSCGIQFFHSPCVPHGYRAQVIYGFVEELVVNDDPEYQWIDKIRTPRASNEARQVVFLKLSGQVQRKIGLKAINLGANAVIGYTQCFDLEGDVGVVARGIGTAVTLVKIQENPQQQMVVDSALIEESSTELALSATTLTTTAINSTVTTTINTSTTHHQTSINQISQQLPSQNLQQNMVQQQLVKQDSVSESQSKKEENCDKILTNGIDKQADDEDNTIVKSDTNRDLMRSVSSQPTSIPGHTRTESVGIKVSSPVKINGSASNSKNAEIFRRSSDSDLSVTPKGNSICVASDRLLTATTLMRLSAPVAAKITTTAENLDMLEYPFLTMTKYPPGFILHLGATVAARSVKLLERVPNLDEPETRDSWWTEIRMEIRSHARALGCNVILGYAEVTTISDDVCVLSATGTAAVINMSYSGDTSQFDLLAGTKKETMLVSSLDERECIKDGRSSVKGSGEVLNKEFSSSYSGTSRNYTNMILHSRGCGICHVPYTTNSVPVNVKMIRCAICKRGKVPDVLMATIEIPECLQITGRGCFMQAQVVRAKKDLRSESNAKEISDGLPFLEYELHRLLINKLKAKGMNAVFGLKTQVAVGEKMMALIATGTALYLSALPTPTVPKIVAGNSWTDNARLIELQKTLQETVEKNREIYQLKNVDPDVQQQNGKHSDTDESEDELLELDLNAGNKDTCVLEVDDIEDLEIIKLLMETCPPDGFHIVNTQTVPGLHDMEVVRNLQMFTQVWRAKIAIGNNTGHFPKHFQRLLQTIYFKLRTLIPCAVCDLRFQLGFPESDEIQILVTGMTLGLAEPKLSRQRRKMLTVSNPNNQPESLPNAVQQQQPIKKAVDDELIFSLDEDNQQTENQSLLSCPPNLQYGSHSLKLKKNSPSRAKFSSVRYSRHLPLNERYGVDITPLSYIPGGRIEKYLGNLNFFFIRESTSIRENGGISGFVHSFITELLAIVRSHVSALGGNAMVSFYMTELILVDNQHKNQGQCLISIGGDVVHVSYYGDD